jgi:hypothetical protein
MTARKTRTNLFCRNADGDIVIVSKIWKGYRETHAAVSLYVVRGRKEKLIRLEHRARFDKKTHTDEMLVAARDTVAHLWAMQNEVSDYVVVYTAPKMVDMYHPTELQQLQQESQP